MKMKNLVQTQRKKKLKLKPETPEQKRLREQKERQALKVWGIDKEKVKS